MEMMEQLHKKTLQRPILELYGNILATIVPIISVACSTIKIAATIARTIVSYVYSRNSRMVALRATPVHLFNDEEKSWPVVEWTEEDDTRSLSIFDFYDIDNPEKGSWLMHSGRQVLVSDRRYWKQSRIDWNVADTEHLKVLFNTQHMLGLLQWGVTDLLQLHQSLHSKYISANEYVQKNL